MRSRLEAAGPDGLSDAELLVREGIGATEAGNHARARALLSLGLTLDQNNVRGWLWLSDEVEAPKDKALCLRRVLALEPGNEYARQRLASLGSRVEDRTDRPLRLRPLVDRATGPDDLSDAELLVREGIDAAEDGNHTRARDLLSLALTLDAGHVRGWLWLSNEVEVPEDKAFCLRRVLALEPGNEFAWQRLASLGGRVEGRTDRPLRLRPLVDRATGPDDLSDAELLVREGIGAAEISNHARARDLLSLGLTLDEGHVRGWMWLSSEVEDPHDKEFCLRRVLALEPDNEFALKGLAWLREQNRLQAEHALLREQRLAREQASLQVQDLPQGQRLLHDLREAVGAGVVLEAKDPGEHPTETMVQPVVERSKGERTQRVSSRPLDGVVFVLRSEFTLIALLGLVLLALIARGVSGLPAPLPLLRLLLGLAYVLFVPGYALQAALFPRKDDLDGPERLALSVGLSVAIVPPVALLLDWLPWGIRQWPVTISEGLVALLLSAAALVRRGRLPVEARPTLDLGVDLKGWWAAQDRTGRLLYAVLAGALLLAAVSASAIILMPNPGEQFTEFYVLGSEGLAESYPREAVPGEVLSVTAGIANREGQAAEYRIEVQVEGELIVAAGPIALEDGEVWEAPITYALPRTGEDQQVEFLLYRDGGLEPYRRLRLWIDVVEEPVGGDE